MSVFIGNKNKRVELAERKDATNPNLFENSKDFIMYTPWGTVKCGNTIHCTKGTTGTGSIYLSSDPNNPGLKENASAYFSCEPNTYYTESLWITSSVALNGVENNIVFQSSSYTDATTIGAKTINLGNNHYKFIGSFYSGTNMANFDIGYITGFNNFVSADTDISFDALKIEKGTVATPWCPALEDYAWTSDITNLQTAIASAGKVKTVNGTQPDNTGNVSIAIPDISGKANKTDVTNLANRVTALEQNSLKIVPITQAAYDALSTKDPNTIYAIGG